MAKIPSPPIPMANPIPRIPKYQPATDRSLSWLPPDRNSLFPDGCVPKNAETSNFLAILTVKGMIQTFQPSKFWDTLGSNSQTDTQIQR